MITVAEASAIIANHYRDYGTELVATEHSQGRVLAESILCDRDLPPFNRSTMDGIAISYSALEAGVTRFEIVGTIAAGKPPIPTYLPNQCVEIMTGAPVPDMLDTVIRYEDTVITGGWATITQSNYRKGQNSNNKGSDRKTGELLVPSSRTIEPNIISVAATVGKTTLLVKKLPKIAIISTGDELVDISAQPGPYQIRRSNSPTLQSVLAQSGIEAEQFHLADNPDQIKHTLAHLLENFDVIILTGGVSMGKFDYLPDALKKLEVEQYFHKIQQRPGKPFWFGGKHDGKLVFAFPGNPVSSFLCMHRYFIPWLRGCQQQVTQPLYAKLSTDVVFNSNLTYFIQIKLNCTQLGQLVATPAEGHGSGDLANLLDTNAFMELPAEQTTFNKGEAYPVWPFKPIGYQ